MRHSNGDGHSHGRRILCDAVDQLGLTDPRLTFDQQRLRRSRDHTCQCLARHCELGVTADDQAGTITGHALTLSAGGDRRLIVGLAVRIGLVILGAAAVDCEQLRAGLLAQPANSLSSLAFVAAGILIVARALRRERNLDGIAVGLAAVATGMASLVFHAGNEASAHWLHDTSLLVVFTLVAIRHIGRNQLSLAQAAPFVAVAASAIVLAIPTSTTLVTALLVLGVVVGGFNERRRGESVIHLPLVATMLFGLSASWLGRKGSVLCSPESVLQPHALWHIVMALSIVWWAETAVLRAPSAPRRRPSRLRQCPPDPLGSQRHVEMADSEGC